MRDLPGDDSSPSKEEHPNTVPPLAISFQDLLLVRDPVLVPTEDGSTIVDAENIDVLDFKTGRLKLLDDPAERAGSIGTRENVFVHEKTPVSIK